MSDKVTYFIVVGPDRRKKVGLVFTTYKEFIEKCSSKFTINAEDVCLTLEDETEVDEEFFEVLESGRELRIKCRRTEKGIHHLHLLAEFLHQCLTKQPSVYNKVMQCLRDPDQSPAVLDLLAQIAKSASASPYRDDAEWFKGLNTKFRTKEAVMRNSAETRIRGYLDMAKKSLLVGTPQLPESPCKKAIDYFKGRLSECKYNANYFDRSAPSGRLCDKDGLFECEGPYNREECDGSSFHLINPYATREARIIFSTWNLDHVIEKSRTILPTLREALEKSEFSDINLDYFYELLFLHKNTKCGNLKLVHIACHDKKLHENTCDSSKVFRSKTTTTTTSNSIDVIDSSLVIHSSSNISRSKRKLSTAAQSEGMTKRPRLFENGTLHKRNSLRSKLKKKA
ncbi:hypothetical protein SK128_021848 [Halocaridina rubra]|uniref:DNAation factor subunit beta n=1 Tax=Halocaridina rubra TaxID=373956 RepID=A0AAN8ZYB6_HALRR